MKKAIVLLLALAVLGGAVFAQATVNGYVRTKVNFTEDGVTYLDRLRLNFNYMTEDKNVVFAARLQGSSADFLSTVSTVTTNTTTAPDTDTVSVDKNSLYYAYGAVKAFDGLLKVTAGKIVNYDYEFGSTGTDWWNGAISNTGYHFEGAKALLVQLYPVEGLDVGVDLMPSGTDFALADLGFSVKYAIADIGTVVVESAMGTDLTDSRYSASFKLSAVENLSAVAGYKHAAADTASVYAIVGYTAGAAFVEGSAEFQLTGSTVYAELFGKYKVNDMLSVAGLFNYSTATSDYLGGCEVYYTVSKKGILQSGLTYGSASGLQIPVIVKVNF